jgi:hypothetical protein
VTGFAEVQHGTELASEGGVAERVKKRVEGGVEVANPRGGRQEARLHAVLAEGHNEEEDEVGQEAKREGSHDDPQLSRCLDLFRQGGGHLQIEVRGKIILLIE